MGYNSYTISDIVDRINESELYLPAIQRRFVWKPQQIEKLFDSIMRGYPIGTFLFWFLKDENINKYTFYKFIQEYHERDSKNEVAQFPRKKGIIGVLDGQQRISSIYIALQGSYAYKRPYYPWNSENAFPKRRLFLNLLYNGSNKEELKYKFEFLPIEEKAKMDKENLWIDVRNVLIWGNDPDIDAYYEELLEKANELESDEARKETQEAIVNNKKTIKHSLRILHKRMVLEELINYYEIKEQDLDSILDIFVRVNSAGTVLSKTDLLFSTIVANWEEGRSEIDSLIDGINKKGEKFNFNSDFIMRACLFLTDSPILFKVNNFDKTNIEKIKERWNEIKRAINKTVDTIAELGFNSENITSHNSIIPIAYYFYHNGKNNNDIKIEIRKYLVSAMLLKVFGNQGDQVLGHIREGIKECGILTKKEFKFKELAQIFEKKSKRKITVQEEDINEILEQKKNAYTFMVLSVLYPDLKYGTNKFHQDHIHPYSIFTKKIFNGMGLEDEKQSEWINMRDKIPNLQLLEGKQNESKSNMPFKQWLDREKNKNDYKKTNYIDLEVGTEFKDFEEFYNKRRENLKEELIKRLGIKL